MPGTTFSPYPAAVPAAVAAAPAFCATVPASCAAVPASCATVPADAAAAVAFVLAVVEPYSSGIGGGGFALLKNQDDIRFLDFREVAPEKASRDMFIRDGKADTSLSRDGVLSVAVPGAVAGYLELQEKYGVLKRKQVLKKAIELAENGVAVTTRYRFYVEKRIEQLRQDNEISRIFLVQNETGAFEAPPIGHLVKQPDLAKTLRAISEFGAEAFYQGDIANALSQDMQSRKGIVSKSDLKNYKRK